MNAPSLSTAGLTAASNRFTANAERIADGSGNPAAELTEQVSAKVAFVAVVRTIPAMSKRSLNVTI